MSNTVRMIGNVNWFDSKKGYGFINVVTPDNDNSGKDIFVHFTSINVESTYKKLYPGEYVEFTIDERDNRLCCTNVTGPFGGPLLIDNENHRYKVYPKVNRDQVDDDGVDVEAEADADADADQES